MEDKSVNEEKEKEKAKREFGIGTIIISGVVGILIGALLLFCAQRFIFVDEINKTIVSSKAGKVTGKLIYKEITKNGFPLTYLLGMVDNQILEKKYKLSDEQEEEINKNVDNIIRFYTEGYGYTEEQFLSSNGYESREEFKKGFEQDYRKDLYFKEVLITDEDVNQFYENNDIYGEITTKHILVSQSTDVTDEQALKIANEIIEKLNSGTSFDDVVTEYAEKSISEEVKINYFNEDGIDKSFVDAAKALEKDGYTKTPVKTSYGYHIILCVNKAEKPTVDDAKKDIKDLLLIEIEDVRKDDVLIKLREENKIKFADKKYKDEYDEFCKEIKEQMESLNKE